MIRRIVFVLFLGACATGGALTTTFGPRLSIPAGAQVPTGKPVPAPNRLPPTYWR